MNFIRSNIKKDTAGEKERRAPILIGVYNYTVILTYLAVPVTFFGLYSAFHGQYYRALVCIMLAGLCDAFDGKVARTRIKSTTPEKRFGIQIDSLVDLICYGVSPAVIGMTMLERSSVAHMLIFSFFVLAAVIRLAFFNVSEEERQNTETGGRKYFRGLPVTSVALTVPFIFIFKDLLGGHFTDAYAIWLLFIGLLFILNFKLRKPGTKALILFILIGLAEVAIIIYNAVIGL